jgi:hypothetical protein
MMVAGEAAEGAFKVNSLGNLENADAGSGGSVRGRGVISV